MPPKLLPIAHIEQEILLIKLLTELLIESERLVMQLEEESSRLETGLVMLEGQLTKELKELFTG